MDFGEAIRARLKELGLEQKDLAVAAEVTESYVSQLLRRKKAPPAPERTDIYGKMESFLRLPANRLASLADHQRRDELTRMLREPPVPLHGEVRDLVVRKCASPRRALVRAVFEKEPFGPLESLVTRTLLDAVKGVARKELDNESWLHEVARGTGRSYEQMRVLVLEFLDADVLTVSVDNCVSFLDPLLESWDIDLSTFAMDIVLNRRLAPGHSRRLEFVERHPDRPAGDEPGLAEFLRDRAMSRDASPDEIEFLKALRFGARRPTPLYYYRALQALRDPLHFREE